MSVKEGLSYTFALSRRFLLMLDTWPEPYISSSQPSIRFVIVMFALSVYVILPQVMNVIRAWGNIAKIVESFSTVNTSVLALIKLGVTRYHGETLRKLLEAVSADWMTSNNKWECNTMVRVAKRGRILSTRCYISSAGTLFFYVFFNSLKFYHSMHHPPRKLVYQFGYPYDTQKSPNYEITFALQIFGGLCTGFINSTVDSFVSMLLLHTCSQLMNLRLSLQNLVDELTKRSISYWKYKKGFAAIVVRHDNLIRNARIIDECYSTMLFMHMIVITFQMCFESFQLYTKITDKNADRSVIRLAFLVFYTAFVLTHLYIYCYSAQLLMDESTKLAHGVYECNWFDLPPKDAKDMMFIVYRSTIPLRLTAGKFGIFSMEMFGATLKTSMGYLSALLTLKD